MSDLPITGGCNCGAVRFEISQPLVAAVTCWCKRCQRRSGTGSAPNARTVPGSFRLVSGAEAATAWDPGDGGWEKVFCGRCGSQVCSRDPADHDRVGVRFGALDGDPGIRPGAHQFTAYAAAWAPVPDDGLPRYPERAPADAGGSHDAAP
jgi:hypothetical protein